MFPGCPESGFSPGPPVQTGFLPLPPADAALTRQVCDVQIQINPAESKSKAQVSIPATRRGDGRREAEWI